ncbi:MAG: thioredoxin domain-containing protein [Deltaproteobacteria bacterium]|nr:thioredoxin domain-containing protein [Deltaproteobacteria bacterium]MBI3294915.1 thioredoxin domain-containing protein [Deltaproteobacteria bacterium]
MKSLFALLPLLIIGCASQEMVKQALNDHPEWVMDAIAKNPEKFLEVANQAGQKARVLAQAKQEADEKTRREEEYKNPKTPEIAKDRAVKGPASAPVTIVEYSDMQCPFCQRGYNTVEELLQKYGNKIRFVFKHLPLDFHPMAMPAAKRFEAIAMINQAKAYEFHDAVFKEQSRLGTEKEAFLDSITKKLGLNLAQVKKNETSSTVTSRLASDKAEAAKFGISGTPGFIVGGITLAGAYPTPAFIEIIEKKLNESKPIG